MSRQSQVRKPHKNTIKRLIKLLKEDTLSILQKRKIETLLLHAEGMNTIEIAAALGVHPNTIYSNLRDFQKNGLNKFIKVKKHGSLPHLSDLQQTLIAQLANQAPYDLGLAYGRWSLSKLRNYLLQNRIIKTISREHLRRILKKRDLSFGALNVNLSAKTQTDQQF